jgi:vancomycin resistance protein YoaR
MRRWPLRLFVVGVLTIFGLVLTAVAAWGVDKMMHADLVTRNVTLAGRAVGGLSPDELDPIIEQLAAEHADDRVVVRADGLEITATNTEAGISLDGEAVKAAVLDAGRQENPVSAFSTWVTAFATPVDIEPIFTIDLDVAREMIRSAPGWVRVPPTEPSFTTATGEVVVTPGRPGEYLDPDEVAESLAAEVAFGESPFAVDITWSPMPPKYGEAEIEQAIVAFDELTDTQLPVRINRRTAYIGTTSLRHWVDSAVAEEGIVPVFNEQRMLKSLEMLFEGYESDYPQPAYRVVDGEVLYDLEGDPAMACCDVGVAEEVRRGAELDGVAYVFLPTKPAEPDGGEARVASLGVKEVVGEFTTNHACCANRVTNIHRIADIIRGVVIGPGERFSVNDYVGDRTREKGFLPAGSIHQGHYTDDVGGGISQFATTLFNAAFFAGLELDDYQSHTIYISRYPYGREATLNYPDVDLAIVNNTPYAVMIWTEYTDTSITVKLYSTHFWDVEQSGQSSWRSGACRSVETFRTRTNPDGDVIEDSVMARYRPGEGLDCNGNPTPRPR